MRMMRRAPDAANNVMCQRVGETQRGGAHKRQKCSLLRKEEEMHAKKKIAMLVAMAAMVGLVALVGSGPALAQQIIFGVIQCDEDPCYATGGHQVVFEQVGDGVADNIYAQGRHDNIRAQNYTNDNDTANGGTGHDLLHVNDGDALDGAIGGPGFDRCVVDATIEASNTCEQVVVR
jgi:hypothetical protein